YSYYFWTLHVDAAKHLLAANKVKPFAELAEILIAESERISATMAGLVEGMRWRVSAKGRRYMVAALSDRSGQFEATVFDDEPSSGLEAAAKAGGCGLLTVELDRRAGDDTPRVTIKRFQPLETLARQTRLQMTIRFADAALAD